MLPTTIQVDRHSRLKRIAMPPDIRIDSCTFTSDHFVTFLRTSVYRITTYVYNDLSR